MAFAAAAFITHNSHKIAAQVTRRELRDDMMNAAIFISRHALHKMSFLSRRFIYAPLFA